MMSRVTSLGLFPRGEPLCCAGNDTTCSRRPRQAPRRPPSARQPATPPFSSTEQFPPILSQSTSGPIAPNPTWTKKHREFGAKPGPSAGRRESLACERRLKGSGPGRALGLLGSDPRGHGRPLRQTTALLVGDLGGTRPGLGQHARPLLSPSAVRIGRCQRG
eukprot:scaffold7377_cov389-Prasinococcus_capsulatus_cf.AAC.30